MKINFGKFKHIDLVVGKNLKMRPTQSRAKSIIFNTISINQDDIVLDLFAGTGLLGFESASLGAKKVYWIDNNIESYRAIKSNINSLNLNKDDFKVFCTDFRRALKAIDIKPTIIFLDPPFIAKGYYEETLNFIHKNDILSKNGVIILEKEWKHEIISINNFEVFKKKRMGEKDILILKLK